MRSCSVCKQGGQGLSLFTLELTADDGEKFNVKVCGHCWDAIAEIANLALKTKVEKLNTRMDILEARLNKVQGWEK